MTATDLAALSTRFEDCPVLKSIVEDLALEFAGRDVSVVLGACDNPSDWDALHVTVLDGASPSDSPTDIKAAVRIVRVNVAHWAFRVRDNFLDVLVERRFGVRFETGRVAGWHFESVMADAA